MLLERDRAFLGEDGSFSWLPMARGHRGVHTEGSELSCHGPGGGTHCGEENPGQGPLREGTSTLPAWRPPLPAALHAHRQPHGTALLSPSKGRGGVPPTEGQCGAVSPCLSFPRWGGGSSRSRKLCPVPPRPAPPYLARTAGPESGPHPTAPPSRPPPREPRRHRAAAAAAPPESGEHRDGPGVPAPSRSSDPDAPPVTGKSPRSAQPDPIGVSPGAVQPDRPRRAADARAKGNGAGAPPPRPPLAVPVSRSFTCADGGRRARAGAGRIPPGGCRKRNTEGGGGAGSQPLGSAPCTVEDRSRQRREPRNPAALQRPQPRRLHRALGSRSAPERSARALPFPKPFPAPGNGLVGNTEPPLRRPTPRALSAAAPHRAGKPTRGFGVSFPLHRSSARLSLCCKNGEMGAKEKRMRLNSNLSMENPPPTPPRDEPGLQDRYHHAANFNGTASGAARSAPCPSLRESCSTVLHATPVALNVGSPPCQRCHRSLPPPDRTRASLSTSHSTQSTAGPTPCATGAGSRAKG